MAVAERRLTRYVRRTVQPYSAFYRDALARADGDIARLPPTDLADVVDPGSLVLRPDLRTIVQHGHRPLAARAVLAKGSGGMHQFNRRVVEYNFKPVHWVIGDGIPLGYSASDVQRLAARGEAWLDLAGVERHDVVLSVLHPGPTVAHWQLALGCRRAGVSAIHLDPALDPEWAERLAPSVLAGEPHHLVNILARSRSAGHRLANLRVVLAVGDPLTPELRQRLRGLTDTAIVAAWAPPGVRALWSECRQAAERSASTGYHTWDDDVLESLPDGELLWTGIGWRGSAVLRLRTHTRASVDQTPCAACGRPSTRIAPLAPVERIPVPIDVPLDSEPIAVDTSADDIEIVGDRSTVEAVLDAETDVAAWQVERRNGESIVVIAPSWGAAVVPLVRRLDRHIAAAQFIVLTADEVTDRVEAAGGRRVVETS